jgi:hypothetical protein
MWDKDSQAVYGFLSVFILVTGLAKPDGWFRLKGYAAAAC